MNCDSRLDIVIDGHPGFAVGCSLEMHHEDAHAHVVDGVEHAIWVTDGDYSGPRAARLVSEQLARRFPA